MKYTMLLWPHANVRYQKEEAHLALAELQLILSKIQPDAMCAQDDSLFMPALLIETKEELSPRAIQAISGHSLLYGLLRNDGQALLPVAGRIKAYLGEDLPGILKYKGKTNEMFTAMLLNMALYSGDYWQKPTGELCVLDPMCGKGTALFVAANKGCNCVGSDMDKKELDEAERFFKKYLEFHRFKHKTTKGSLTLGGGKSAPWAGFSFADTPENFSAGNSIALKLVQMDAREVLKGYGKNTFHAIVCDLPYGVQHASKGGMLDTVLQKALPAWFECLKKNGSCVISFNAATLSRSKVVDAMEKAGFTALCGGIYDTLAHWVEQAVTRDLVVGVKK